MLMLTNLGRRCWHEASDGRVVAPLVHPMLRTVEYLFAHTGKASRAETCMATTAPEEGMLAITPPTILHTPGERQ